MAALLSGLFSQDNCSCFSSFCDSNAKWRTDSSLGLEDGEADDVYEMALEVLEGDEAYRMESSGSISPESDVDRLLENADTERFSGDVTLIRIFSVRQDDFRRNSGNSIGGSFEEPSASFSSDLNVNDELSDSRSDIHLQEKSSTEKFWTSPRDQDEVNLEPSSKKFRNFPDSRNCWQDFDSADLVSIDLNSDVNSLKSDYPVRPNGLSEKDIEDIDDSFCKNSGLICCATFSNVRSKDARIRTALTSNPLDDNEAPGNRSESDVSLHLTSSDSLYSTDDCVWDSSFVDLTAEGQRFRLPASQLGCPTFGYMEPSPEELFDQALETRSDLAGSICSSSQMSPQCVYYDAFQCSPLCCHRGPSPEDAFDLALETLSDVIDDSSSSVFVIAPKQTDHTRKEKSAIARAILHGDEDNDCNVREENIMADHVSGSSCDLHLVRHYSVNSNESGGSSRKVILDDDLLHFAHLKKLGESSDDRLMTDDCCEGVGEGGRDPREHWTTDIPSSPELSFAVDYSTDECVGESEEDGSMTDYDGAMGLVRSPGINFFQRLLRRRQFQETENNMWTDEESQATAAEEDLLDQIRICSIEDLMTDSDMERDSRNLNALTAPCRESVCGSSPVFPLFHIKDPDAEQTELPCLPLSPPIMQAVRTDIHFARKSKIPKLPESRTNFSPVRISW